MRVFRELTHPWVQSQEWVDAHPQHWFEKWALEPRVSLRPRAWIVDLDSTLFCVTPRIRAVFSEFLDQRPHLPTWHRDICERLDPSNQCYDIPRTLVRLMDGLVEAERRRSEAERLWDEFQPFWVQNFFSNRFMILDLPSPGSQQFAQRVLAEGDHLIYLTGRDQHRCGEGTRRSLEQNGFPLGERTHLMLKPDAKLGDLEFKRQACEQIKNQFDVVFSVDNEPENLTLYAEVFPRADICFFHTVMSHRVPQQKYGDVLAGRTPWRLWDFLGTKNP